MEREALWAEVRRRFDVYQPPADPKWKVARTERSLKRLRQTLSGPSTVLPKCLLAGTTGSGKSAELLDIAANRAGRDFVVFFDVDAHLRRTLKVTDAIDRIQSWELCTLIGLSAFRAIEAQFPRNADQGLLKTLDACWARLLGDASGEPRLDIGKLIKGIAVSASTLIDGGAVFAPVAGLADAVRWDRRIGRSRHADLDEPAVQAVMNATAAIIEHAARLTEKRVLVVLDGVDRMRDVTNAAAVFVDSLHLSSLPCALVVTAPFAMRFSTKLRSARGFKDFLLVNEPVLDEAFPDDRAKINPVGLKFFQDLCAKRLEGLAAPDTLIAPEEVRTLAWFSGGNPREFVRLVFEAASEAEYHKASTIEARHVEEVVEDLRRGLATGLFKQHVEVLQAIRADRTEFPAESDALHELFDDGRLLPYSNGHEWFYPHPGLIEWLDARYGA